MTKLTKARIRALADLMRQHGRSDEEIAQEIRVGAGLSPLAAFRALRGWSQTEAAARFTHDSPGLALDQAALSRIEMWPDGGRPPLAVQLVAFGRLYGTSPLSLLSAEGMARLEKAEQAVVLRLAQSSTPALPASADQTAHFPPIAEGLRTSHTPSPERQVEMAANKSMRFGALVEGSSTSAETVQSLYEETARLASLYPKVSLNSILGDLVEAQDLCFIQLEKRQKPSRSRDLYVIAGVLSLMLAKAAHDTGDPRSAMKQARTAAICAEQAEHPGLMIRVRAQQSLMAYWAGWPSEAARYATAAEELTGPRLGSGAVWLASQAARTWASLGDAEKAMSTLVQAEELRATMEPDDLDGMGGLMHFASCRQAYYEAETRIWVPGEEEQAKEAAQRAISAYEVARANESDDWAIGDEAGARADLAFARVCLGEVEGARDALVPVLDLPADQRVAGIMRSVMRVHEPLRQPQFVGSAVVRQMREEIETYAQTPAAAVTSGGR